MKANPTLRVFIILFVITFGLSFGLQGQSITGDWFGLANVQGMNLRINLHVTGEPGNLKGSFDSPDQGAMGIPLTQVTLKGQNFTFSFVQAGFVYDGMVDPGFTFITGSMKQNGMNINLTFTRTPPEMPENSSEKIKEIYEKKEVYIEMRDGVKLFTSIYSPKNMTRPAPMIMMRSPYNSEPGGESEFNFFVTAYYRFVKEGYILVFQDVRGRYMSYGKFVNVRPFNPEKKGKEIDEASDTYDTADWLVKNVANNNGRIGVMGISYPGFYSTMAILANHPAIKAVSPQAPVTGWFVGDDWHHNGAFMLLDGFSFYSGFGDPMAVPTRQGRGTGFRMPVPDSYEFFMRVGDLKNTRQYFPDSVKYWQELMEHPNYDSWWKATDPRPYLKKVQPAVMTVGGWFDAEDLWGTLHTYEAIESQNSSKVNNTLVMGPWSHGQWALGNGENMGNIYWGLNANDAYHQLEVRFFNYYLKDEGSQDFPEATIFVTGANKWTSFDEWPPKNTEEKEIWFQPDGRLDFSAPTVTDNFDEYISDPAHPVPYQSEITAQRGTGYMDDDQRFASRRPDVVTYKSDLLEQDMTVTGPITVDLFVSTTGTDADWVVKVIDVFPDRTPNPPGKDVKVPYGGYEMLVRGDVMRGKYRNSYEKPEPFEPGKITEVKFELNDIAHCFKEGHRIMVQVQNSWFPLVDLNPQKFVDIYTCDESDFQKATMRVYHDKKNRSGIKVMVLNENDK
jgi:putative CocE/NonD family hydrolase